MPAFKKCDPIHRVFFVVVVVVETEYLLESIFFLDTVVLKWKPGRRIGFLTFSFTSFYLICRIDRIRFWPKFFRVFIVNRSKRQLVSKQKRIAVFFGSFDVLPSFSSAHHVRSVIYRRFFFTFFDPFFSSSLSLSLSLVFSLCQRSRASGASLTPHSAFRSAASASVVRLWPSETASFLSEIRSERALLSAGLPSCT